MVVRRLCIVITSDLCPSSCLEFLYISSLFIICVVWNGFINNVLHPACLQMLILWTEVIPNYYWLLNSAITYPRCCLIQVLRKVNFMKTWGQWCCSSFQYTDSRGKCWKTNMSIPLYLTARNPNALLVLGFQDETLGSIYIKNFLFSKVWHRGCDFLQQCCTHHGPHCTKISSQTLWPILFLLGQGAGRSLPMFE